MRAMARELALVLLVTGLASMVLGAAHAPNPRLADHALTWYLTPAPHGAWSASAGAHRIAA